MQTGGEALERYAQGRASEAVRELEAAAPRVAHRVADGVVEDVPADTVRVGDELLLRPGELLACDAVGAGGPIPRGRLSAHRRARAGARAIPASGCSAAASTSRARSRSGPRLRPARASMPGSWSWSAPRRRASRRSSGWPIATPSGSPRSRSPSAPGPSSLSGDPTRVLAVLVVATPCPLILATPVAVVGGINRAARRGIIFRHGTALEQLGRITRRHLRQDRNAHDRAAEGARVLAVAPLRGD